MATFISTIKFTQQGLKGIGDTTRRAGALKAGAKKMGVKVTNLYWTLGDHDGVLIFDAADDDQRLAFAHRGNGERSHDDLPGLQLRRDGQDPGQGAGLILPVEPVRNIKPEERLQICKFAELPTLSPADHADDAPATPSA